MGNIVNRVFDSSGPEGKVRGTPQQIIDKYNQLARDAQLGNDRVAAENFQQHAEHYARLLSEAMREQEAKREQQEAQQNRERQNQQQRGDGGEQAQGAHRGDGDQQQSGNQRAADRGDDNGQTAGRSGGEKRDDGAAAEGRAAVASHDVVDMDGTEETGNGLVETPEEKPAPRKRGRPKKAAKPQDGDSQREPKKPRESDKGDSGAGDTSQASAAE